MFDIIFFYLLGKKFCTPCEFVIFLKSPSTGNSAMDCMVSGITGPKKGMFLPLEPVHVPAHVTRGAGER